jgi:hypothetical protein
MIKITQKPHISASVPPEVYAEIQKIAERESRSISSTVTTLLESAIKERARKRKVV